MCNAFCSTKNKSCKGGLNDRITSDSRRQAGELDGTWEHVDMIPEKLSFRIETHSGMNSKFVLHSHDRVDRLNLRRCHLHGFRVRSKTKMAQVTRKHVIVPINGHICNFNEQLVHRVASLG